MTTQNCPAVASVDLWVLYSKDLDIDAIVRFLKTLGDTVECDVSGTARIRYGAEVFIKTNYFLTEYSEFFGEQVSAQIYRMTDGLDIVNIATEICPTSRFEVFETIKDITADSMKSGLV